MKEKPIQIQIIKNYFYTHFLSWYILKPTSFHKYKKAQYISYELFSCPNFTILVIL